MEFQQKQSGAALFTALIFLMILTLLGVTALRNSGLSEKMSANAQISKMAYNAAESAMDRYIAEYNYNVAALTTSSETDVGLKIAYLSTYLPTQTATSFFEYCLDNATSVKTNYPLNTIVTSCGAVTLDPSLDPNDSAAAGAVSAWTSVTYQGCPGSCPRYSLGLGKQKVSCHVLKMEAQGRVDQTTAYIDQWVSLQGPC
jgi:Tfp pilus assembly protein PilX